jgi:hypothetical protein
MEDGWRPSVPQVFGLFLLSLATFWVVAVLSLATIDWVSLPVQLAPDGPTCVYERDMGSGPAGLGREEIEWGAFPTRACRYSLDGTPGAEGVYRPGAPLLILLLVPFVALAGSVMAYRLGRRRFRRAEARASGTSPSA